MLIADIRETIKRHVDGADALSLAVLIHTLSIGRSAQPSAADAPAAASKPQRFERTGDGILDNRTGLTWSGTLLDGKNVNQAKAAKACSALGEGWRLPTVEEMRELVDYTKHDPCTDIPDTKSAWYWTSTPDAADPDYAWIVYFGGGAVYDCYRVSGYGACVRAVRASAPRQ